MEDIRDTRTRNDEIIKRLRTEEVTLADMARAYNITRQRVHQIVVEKYGENARSLGIIARVNRRSHVRAALRVSTKTQLRLEREALRRMQMRQIIELKNKGWSQGRISRELGMSQSWVSVLLSRWHHLLDPSSETEIRGVVTLWPA